MSIYRYNDITTRRNDSMAQRQHGATTAWRNDGMAAWLLVAPPSLRDEPLGLLQRAGLAHVEHLQVVFDAAHDA